MIEPAGITALLSSGFGLFIFLFIILWLILWTFLPFAIFGTKPRLNNIETALLNNNRELKKIVAELVEQNKLLKEKAS